jgi:hypothetical protein
MRATSTRRQDMNLRLERPLTLRAARWSAVRQRREWLSVRWGGYRFTLPTGAM